MDDLAALSARAQTISRLIPLLNAIRSVAEIAWRRAEAGFQPLASYAERVQTTLERVASSMHDAQRQNLLAGWGGQRPVALLLVTSERGLCGPFNSHVVQAGLQEAQAWSAQGRTVNFLCLGSKGRRGLEAYGQSVAYGGPLPSFSVPSYISIEQVALDLLDLLEQGGFGQLMIIHNAPVGRFQYGISKKQLLPPAIHIRQSRPRGITVKPANDVPALVNHLLTEYLLVGLYQVVLESVISEQLARIYTMRLATENAQKLLDDLNLQYNLAQRQQITNSLLEIVSGYGATLRRVP